MQLRVSCSEERNIMQPDTGMRVIARSSHSHALAWIAKVALHQEQSPCPAVVALALSCRHGLRTW